MAQIEDMFPGKAYSPETTIAAAVSASAVSIEVSDGTVLPDAPNIATIGSEYLAETIIYLEKNGNVLNNVQRGVQESGVGKPWPVRVQ